MKYTFFLLLFLFFNTSISAQDPTALKAMNLLERWQSKKAIQLFGKKPATQYAPYLAKAYYQAGDMLKTITYARIAIEGNNYTRNTLFIYARALQHQGRPEANAAYRRYLEEGAYDQRADNALNGFKKSFQDCAKFYGLKYKIRLVPVVNTDMDEIAITTYQNSTFVLQGKSTKGPRERLLYYISNNDTKALTTATTILSKYITLYKSRIARKFRGPSSLAGLTDKFIITVTYKNPDTKRTMLQLASVDGLPNLKNDPKLLPFSSTEYNCTYPALSMEGDQLYFASDMPGGFGGWDLYVSYLEEGEWGTPMNLGPSINTSGDEILPALHESYLYFSSDGLVGFGGFDIFKSRDNGSFLESPINLGPPINSKANEVGFCAYRGHSYGVFSSDRRQGPKGFNLYEVIHQSKKVAITPQDRDNRKAIIPDTLELLNASYEPVDCKIDRIDKDSTIIYTIPDGYTFFVRTVAEGYQTDTTLLEFIRDSSYYNRFIPMGPIEYEFQGSVVHGSQSDTFRLDSIQVELISYTEDSISIQQTITDSIGQYTFTGLGYDSRHQLFIRKEGLTDYAGLVKDTYFGDWNTVVYEPIPLNPKQPVWEQWEKTKYKGISNKEFILTFKGTINHCYFDQAVDSIFVTLEWKDEQGGSRTQTTMADSLGNFQIQGTFKVGKFTASIQKKGLRSGRYSKTHFQIWIPRKKEQITAHFKIGCASFKVDRQFIRD